MTIFICVEGVDAVGKTEVGKCLAERLGYQYYKSPGGLFSSARSIVDTDVDPLTRYFFYRAATQHDSKEKYSKPLVSCATATSTQPLRFMEPWMLKSSRSSNSPSSSCLTTRSY